MRAVIACVLMALAAAPVATAADRKAGLMWHDSGLPAVFPLIVKTVPGPDYYLTLHEAETGQAVLAAYIEGGAFFRVLVPPGTFRLRFAAGAGWIDEEQLFGSETTRFDWPEPLTFAVVDHAGKGGHIVDLTRHWLQARSAPVSLCQGITVVEFPRPLPPFDDAGFETRLTPPGALTRHPKAGFDAQKAAGLEAPSIPTDHAPYFSGAEFNLRTRLCP